MFGEYRRQYKKVMKPEAEFSQLKEEVPLRKKNEKEVPTKGFPNRGTVTQHEYVGNSRTHGKSHTFLPCEGHENSFL